MSWQEYALRNHYEPSSTRRTRLNAYACLADGTDVEVIGECTIEWWDGRQFADDVEIIAVRTDPDEEPIEIEDLTDEDRDLLTDALEEASEEL